MNVVKMTALILSVIVIPGLISGCTRTHVRTEERPYGQSYVRETPEEQRKNYVRETPEEQRTRTYKEEEKRNAAGEMERTTKEHIKETGEKTSRELNPYNKPKSEEAYSKEIRREHKTQPGRT